MAQKSDKNSGARDIALEKYREGARLVASHPMFAPLWSHAHVLLGGGWAPSGGYVDYGLGNFGFYAKKQQTTQTGVLELTAVGRVVTDARWVPARIKGGIPRQSSEADRERIAAAKEELRECTDLRASPPPVADE